MTRSLSVFGATVAAGRPRRLVYTSSVAAYGYHADNPVPMTEDVPPRGSPEHYYSEPKAACEAALAEITVDAEIHCRRDTVGVGRGDLVVVGILGGPARRGATFVGPVGATVGSLGGVALDVVVRTLCARIRFCGLGPVPVHGS